MQVFLESAVVTLTLAGSFVVAFVMQKTVLGVLLKVMTLGQGERRTPSSGVGP